MRDSPPSRILTKGKPTGARVVLYSRAYAALARLIRITAPSTSVGALIGTLEHEHGEDIITIKDVQPVRMVQIGEELIPDLEEWTETVHHVLYDSQLELRVVGWYCVGPRVVDATQVQHALLPDAHVLLLVDIAADEGAFYVWRNDSFQPTYGFYELLTADDPSSIVPWTGNIQDPGWTVMPLATPREGPATSLDTDTQPPGDMSAESAEREASGTTQKEELAPTQELVSHTNTTSTGDITIPIEALIDLAESFQAQGNVKSALATYGHALRMTPPGSAVSKRLLQAIDELETRYLESPPSAGTVEAGAVEPEHTLSPDETVPGNQQVKEDGDLAERFDAGLPNHEHKDGREAERFYGEVEPAYHEAGVPQPLEALLPPMHPEPEEPHRAERGLEVVSGTEVPEAQREEPTSSRAYSRGIVGVIGVLVVLVLLAAAVLLAGGLLRATGSGASPTRIAEAQPLAGGPTLTPVTGDPTGSGVGQGESAKRPTPVSSVVSAASPVAGGAATGPSAQPSATPRLNTPAQMAPGLSAPSPTTPAATAAPAVAAATYTATYTVLTPAIDVTVDTLRQKVATAEAAVRSGQLEVQINSNNTTSSVAAMRFDLGDSQHPPSYYLKATYHSTRGPQTTEYLVIGDRSWQRTSQGKWTDRPGPEEAPWGQVHSYLPGALSASNIQLENSAKPATLRWYDAQRDADVNLQVDSSTGIPLQMRQVSRSNGSVLSVKYTGWNTPVTIPQP